jgi:hypothetical protein
MLSPRMLRRVALVRTNQTVYHPEDGILHSHRRNNLKSWTEVKRPLERTIYFRSDIIKMNLRRIWWMVYLGLAS